MALAYTDCEVFPISVKEFGGESHVHKQDRDRVKKAVVHFRCFTLHQFFGKHMQTMTTLLPAQQKLDHIVKLLGQPGGFARLDTNQRKFLFGVIFAMIVPADSKVRECELVKLQNLLRGLNAQGNVVSDTMSIANKKLDSAENVEILARAMGELLGSQDRSNFVRQLWEIALSDDELHDTEEQLIFRIADLSGVNRKHVAAELAKAAAKH